MKFEIGRADRPEICLPTLPELRARSSFEGDGRQKRPYLRPILVKPFDHDRSAAPGIAIHFDRQRAWKPELLLIKALPE
jgi:hypothetical protein